MLYLQTYFTVSDFLAYIVIFGFIFCIASLARLFSKPDNITLKECFKQILCFSFSFFVFMFIVVNAVLVVNFYHVDLEKTNIETNFKASFYYYDKNDIDRPYKTFYENGELKIYEFTINNYDWDVKTLNKEFVPPQNQKYYTIYTISAEFDINCKNNQCPSEFSALNIVLNEQQKNELLKLKEIAVEKLKKEWLEEKLNNIKIRQNQDKIFAN